MSRLRKRTGFTLIELLIVVAIIGIIAALAIPNLLNAIDRGKQKSTMANMRSISTSVEQYAIDVNFYPISTSMAALSSLGPTNLGLQPTYIKLLPVKDGWGGQIYYGSDGTGAGSDYTIVSYGKDKKQSSTSAGATNDFDCDIIFQNGTFTAYPDGIQT